MGPSTAMALPAKKVPASGSMKAKKTMKAKRVSKIAKGRMAKAQVLRGSKEKTAGGLTRSGLIKNKRGKVVSKRASAAGNRRYKYIQAWVKSVVAARKALNMKGFVAVNGSSAEGKALYAKSKALFAAGNSAA